ncbi:MAG: bifunctional 4-hydroxy-2-oxoglutarate aldolase/2-dehydro-3-deoxy-phosphogluconate aldolase [Blastocatellia bacterium]|nr:bifunctional 4-hydroxy-2-oxoglutarate aldolase/2-dehydro-3-deoxy-phosphogluconate aldolase [Blastocatellia bacterium]
MRPVFEQQLNFFSHHRVSGIVRAGSAEVALKAAEAAIMGGIKILEVPYTTPGAIRIISDLRRIYGERILIGCGSITTVEMADRAVKGNAQFITSPHTNAALIEFCCSHNVFAIPGAATPTEVISAAGFGVPLVNVFPAGLLGGAPYIRTLHTFVPDVRLMAIGGVTSENLADFLNAGATVVGLGGSLFKAGHIANGNFAGIAESARRVVKQVQGTF